MVSATRIGCAGDQAPERGHGVRTQKFEALPGSDRLSPNTTNCLGGPANAGAASTSTRSPPSQVALSLLRKFCMGTHLFWV
ncbi:hypothetical protein AWV79_18205 [Cupriavidus sp. UYMMa02A]|nr:hypothetical protein AWV79_18205 [Cupriavidus sp. UYMMa02A]